MGNSYSTFDLPFLPAPTEGWQFDPCILYDSRWDGSTGNTNVQKLLAAAISEEGSIDSIHSNNLQLPATWTDWTSAETLDSESEKKDGQPVHLPNPPWAICKAGTQVRDPCIAMRIPEEIWKLVAANMSAADWARVSCTSRALSRVQLETLSLAPRSAAGINWATAHWREAKFVALTVRGWDQQAMEQLSEVFKVKAAYTAGETCKAAAMQHVRHIALHLEAGSSSYSCFQLWEILSASYTPRLESLCIVCDKTVLVGTIPTLKHLRIEVKHQSLFPMRRNLGSYFEQLETLTICSDIHVKHWGYQDFDFAELESLRCINLQMVLPQGLTVPPGCQVHLVCHNISGASQVWDRGLGAACTSCHLLQLLPFEQSAGQPSLPQCLQRIAGFSCPHLTVLALICSAVGSQEEPLVIGNCLPALRELEIRVAEDLHVWVGSRVSLESLILCSGGMLHFEMEDLDCLLSGLKAFRNAYKRCCMVTHMLLWHISHISKGTIDHNVDASTEVCTGWAPECKYVAVETGMCRDHTCGTCIDCLRRKHLPVSDNAEWPFVGLFAQLQ